MLDLVVHHFRKLKHTPEVVAVAAVVVVVVAAAKPKLKGAEVVAAAAKNEPKEVAAVVVVVAVDVSRFNPSGAAVVVPAELTTQQNPPLYTPTKFSIN